MDDAARKHGISTGLLISAHRHRSEADALALLDSILPWSDRILGVGLGGAEAGNPPSKFARFFHTARKKGFHTTVHAGEEGPAAYVREAIELLQVDRIDHGIACLGDPALVEDLAEMTIPLTVCPLSKLKLKVVRSVETHPLKTLLDAGLRVTINSDDPPYFGAYVSENLLACQQALGLSVSDIAQLARNGFSSAFISQDEAGVGIGSIDAYLDEHVAFS
jgi:adenosine deaminase